MEKEQVDENWSEAVEDLVAAGDTEGAISLLESVLSNLQTLNSSHSASQLQLASALTDLAKLYSSKGFSLKADDLESRASLIKQRATQIHTSAYFYLPFSFFVFFLLCSNFSCFIFEHFDQEGQEKGYLDKKRVT